LRRASVGHGPSAASGPSVFERQEQRLRIAKEEAAARRDQSMMKECTFKPQTSRTSAMYAVNQISLEERIERLSKPSAAAQKEKEAKRREAEEKEAAECTFHPQINQRSKLIVEGHPPVEQRLHMAQDEKVASRERLKRMKEEEELKKLTFAPQINATSLHLAAANPERRPLYERVGELQREKDEKLHRLRMRRIEEENLTFTPHIDEVSAALAKARRAGELDVTERLSRTATAQVHSRYSAQEEMRQRLEAEATHRPALNPISERIVEESAMFQGPNKDFLARQKAYEQRKREVHQEVLRRASDKSTFEPRISGVSELLVQSQPARANETFVDKIERLAYRDKERIEKDRQSLTEEYYSQFTHKPNINKISSIIGQAHTHEELYRNEKSKRVQEKVHEAAEQAFKKEFTFHPKVSKTSEEIANKSAARIPIHQPEDILTRIEQQKQEKEQKLEEMRKNLEYEQSKGLTFRPKLAPKVKQPEGPVIVPGIARHLELVKMAKQKTEDQKKREEEVFGLKRDGTPHDPPLQPYTIPEPFALSADPHAHIKKARIRQEALAAELKECTFHPATNAGRDSALIRQILQDTTAPDASALNRSTGSAKGAPRRASVDGTANRGQSAKKATRGSTQRPSSANTHAAPAAAAASPSGRYVAFEQTQAAWATFDD
jgi:hypothetical protein